MLSFDLGKEEFKELVSRMGQPCLIQLLGKVDTGSPACSPLELYHALRTSGTSGYSYLLESVEKEASRARYSFIGSDPDAVLKISDRKISLELLNPKASDLFDSIWLKMEEVCGPETVKRQEPEKGSGAKNSRFTAAIPAAGLEQPA